MTRRWPRAVLPFALLTLCACTDPVPPATDGGLDRGGDGSTGPGPDMIPPCDPSAGPCEACNGRDDDGDGVTDEGVPMAGAPCGGAACGGTGRWTCVSGEMICAGVGGVAEERCNGEDDDCDGRIDESDPRVGEPCAACAGTYYCEGGDLRCTMGAAEVCNGLNDDCDEATDERLTRPCGEATGACEPGMETCVDGVWGGCIGGTGPNGETCNSVDDDCDGAIDEQLADCNGLGTPCDGDAECSSGLCLDDDGSRYCSRPCDPAEARPCGPGNRCLEIDGRAVCVPDWQACNNDCACGEGQACMPADNHPDIAYGCRPERQDGQPVGAPCVAADRVCASGSCPRRVARCTRYCGPLGQCGGVSACDEGTACVPLGLEQPVCLRACTADTDCPTYPGQGAGDPVEICRFRVNAEGSAHVGVCDWPNDGGAPIGGPCDGGADCAHGLCWQLPAADNYCTKGCVTVDDCPAGWRCDQNRLNGLDLSICVQ